MGQMDSFVGSNGARRACSNLASLLRYVPGCPPTGRFVAGWALTRLSRQITMDDRLPITHSCGAAGGDN